jgi:Xaa-Pro dipeptidase
MQLRFVKSAEEIIRIKEATRISEKVLKALINKLEEGVSDVDLIKLAKIATLKNGGTGTNHITLSIGDSDPEAPGTGRKIVKGEMTRFDTGAVYKGYVSDISRHACLGPAPEDAKKVVETIVELQDLCIDAVKPGIAVSEVDAIITNYFDTHSRDVTVFPMGHGVGLNTEEFHFLPGSLWGTESMVFKPGMIFDLEFWTPYEPYKNRLLGMEDTYLVTNNGCKRISKLERKIFEK